MSADERVRDRDRPLAIRVVISGPPQPQERGRIARTHVGARIMEPARSRSWKGAAKVAMQAAVYVATGREEPPWPADVPLEVHILAVFPLPASDHLRRGVRPRAWHTKAQGDGDNIAKAVADAGNGALWIDDRQIVRWVVEKVIAAQNEAPRVEVRVAPTLLAPERAGLEPFAGAPRSGDAPARQTGE